MKKKISKIIEQNEKIEKDYSDTVKIIENIKKTIKEN